MGFLILTYVSRKSYCILKKRGDCAADFSECELKCLLAVLKRHRNYFFCNDILHSDFYKINRISLKRQRECGRMLISPMLDTVARESGSRLVAIEQREMLKYNLKS